MGWRADAGAPRCKAHKVSPHTCTNTLRRRTNESEAGAAEPEIACSDMHDRNGISQATSAHGGASVALDLVRRMRQRSKIALKVGFGGVFVLPGLPAVPGLRRVSGCSDSS